VRLTNLTGDERERLKNLQFKTLEAEGYFFPTGSREIGGWNRSSDFDFVISWGDYNVDLRFYLRTQGFSSSTFSIEGSYRLGNLNIIVTDQPKQWEKATKLAKALRLREKESRINLFENVLNGRPIQIVERQVGELPW